MCTSCEIACTEIGSQTTSHMIAMQPFTSPPCGRFSMRSLQCYRVDNHKAWLHNWYTSAMVIDCYVNECGFTRVFPAANATCFPFPVALTLHWWHLSDTNVVRLLISCKDFASALYLVTLGLIGISPKMESNVFALLTVMMHMLTMGNYFATCELITQATSSAIS